MRSLAWVVVLSVAGAVGTPGSGVAWAEPGVELSRPSLSTLNGGWVSRMRQRHQGLPVIGGSVVQRIDAQGRVVRTRSTTWPISSVDMNATVSRATAVSIARAHGASGVEHPASATLAIDPRAIGGPRLEWAVRLQPVPELLENALYLVDAKSGALLKRIDLLKYANASVYQQNPTEKAMPEVRAIPAPFAPTSADKHLSSALLEGNNCVDKNVTTSFMGIPVHICSVSQTAVSDGAGDFTAYLPNVEPWASPLNGCPGATYDTNKIQPLDEFSEQHMYWHVANAYAFFRGLFDANGQTDWKLRQQPFPVAVNLCTPNFSGGFQNLNGPLVPFDNAFFSPGMNNPISEALIGGKDAVMFGQGSKYDFAYDGDVIVHEFTHAVIDTLGKLTDGGFIDTQGLNSDPGAMNEGLADYFSGVLGSDPALGEYAGRNFPGGTTGEGALRDMTNKDLCNDDRIGEAHKDSEAFSAGVWGGRVTVAGDPKTPAFDKAKATLYDRAVLAAIAASGDAEDMPSMAQAIADEAGMLIDAAAKAAVEASFATHHILPGCERVIAWDGMKKKALLLLDGTDSMYAPADAARVPSHLQFKVDVPADHDSITLTTNVRVTGGGSPLGGGMPPTLELAVGPRGEKIVWTAGSDTGNYVATAPFSGNKGVVTATVSGLQAGPNYVMMLNSGGSNSAATNIAFSTSCSKAEGCMSAPDLGSDDAGNGANNGGGCSCDVSRRSPATPLLFVLLAIALFAIRRRRA